MSNKIIHCNSTVFDNSTNSKSGLTKQHHNKKFKSSINQSWLISSSFYSQRQQSFLSFLSSFFVLNHRLQTTSITSGSCSPFSLCSKTFCSISTEFRAVPQLSCYSNLCLQQGSRSTFNFCSLFLLKLLCRHRLTFRSRSACKTSSLSF